MKRNLQPLEQVFRERTFALKTDAHPVKPAERILAVVIRKCEILYIDLQTLRPHLCSEHGLSQFLHPGPHQAPFELQDSCVRRSWGDSKHAMKLHGSFQTIPMSKCLKIWINSLRAEALYCPYLDICPNMDRWVGKW